MDANFYFEQGNEKFSQQDYQGAVEAFSKAIELNPKLEQAYNNRGIARYELKDYKSAVEDYTKAIKLNSNNYNAYNNRGNAKGKMDNYKSAIKDYSKAIKLNPKYDNSYNNRGLAKGELKKNEDTIENITNYNRGLVKGKLKINEDAIEDIIKGIEKGFEKSERPENIKTVLQFNPVNLNSLHCILNDELWFAHPSTFNDPLDGNFLQKYFNENDSLLNVLNRVLVSSFVKEQNNTNQINYESLMWAHYSQNHTGMCLVYEFIDNKENPFFINSINYLPEIKSPNLKNIQSVISDGFFTKHEIWKYENEVRILTIADKQENGKLIKIKDLGLKLKEIIFGLKCSKYDRFLITNLLENRFEFKSVQFFEMVENTTTNFFELTKQPYIKKSL